jgi:hypothetical protein
MLITGVNNTGNNLFTGVNDTGDKFIVVVIAVSLIPAINLLPVTTSSVIRCVGFLWTRLFMAVQMKPSASVSDFGGRCV